MLEPELETALKEAIKEGRLYDFIANQYYGLGSDSLKEIILAMLGVTYDEKGDEGYNKFQKDVEKELHERAFFEEDW